MWTFPPLDRWFGKAPKPLSHSPALPPGLRIFAFGDLHGRADLLDRLKQRISVESTQAPAERQVVVGLGDYVDRGPDSRAVLDGLIEGFGEGLESVMLRGNHEAVLLDFLKDPGRTGDKWIEYGGGETLRSYRVPLDGEVSAPQSRARDALVGVMPVEHMLFLERTRIHASYGDYYFVHAGARPGVALSAQTERDSLWIRKGFSDRDAPFEKVVVHGHTPVDEPYIGQYRINLDTGAYATGRLVCLILEGEDRRLVDIA